MRSDTVTKPDARMTMAMMDARLGDDVYGEDPTVNELEHFAAELLGKEAALFVPSGTMGNLVAIGAHCPRGGEMIVGRWNHIFVYESAGASACLGVGYNTVENESDGTLDFGAIKERIRADDDHYPRTKLVAVENTQNRRNGAPLSADYMDQLGEMCRIYGIPLHVDGARLFNAAVSLGVPAARLLESADSASVCLSKGLGAPVGSLVVGSKPFIKECRRLRKRFGGGMRQAGILAACGLVALRENVDDLARDHRMAKSLARGLALVDGIMLDPSKVRTNIIYFDIDPAVGSHRFLSELEGYGFRVGMYGTSSCRAVLHRQVPEEAVDRLLSVVQDVMPRLRDQAREESRTETAKVHMD